MHLVASGAGLVARSPRCIRAFRLQRPTTVEEAVAAFRDAGEGARYAAGCTDLLPRLRHGDQPDTLVSLARVAELQTIVRDGNRLSIGACVDHHSGATHPVVRRALPGLAEAWAAIANVRIRFRATIGGNVMARDERYEMPIVLDALGARLAFRGADGGAEGRIAELDACAPDDGALLTEVSVPDVDAAVVAYDRSLRPSVTVAVALRRGDRSRRGRVVVKLEGVPFSGADFEVPDAMRREQVGDLTSDTVQEMFGSAGLVAAADVRRRIVRVLFRRRLEQLVFAER